MRRWLVVLVLLAGCGTQLSEGQRLWCARNQNEMVDTALDLEIEPAQIVRSKSFQPEDLANYRQAFKVANEKPGRWPKYEREPSLQAIWYSDADYSRVCVATIESR